MTRSSRPLVLGSALGAAAAAVLLAGCGPTSTAAPQTQTGGGSGTNGSANGAQRGDRVSGTIADIDGKTVQVQTRDAQTAVTYSASTTFTQQVSAKADAVTVGDCVAVRSAQNATSASPDAQPTTVTATSVAITAATNGSCGMGGGPGGSGSAGGTPPSGAPSGMPSGAPPNGMPSAAPNGNGGNTGGSGQPGTRPVSGTVASVTDGGFTVTTQQPGGSQAQTVTVTTSDSTTYTQQQKATKSDLKVGLCLSAAGKPDSTGTVAATSIALSKAVDGQCTTGMRGGR